MLSILLCLLIVHSLSAGCPPDSRDCLEDEFVCIPGVGCVAIESGNGDDCIRQCGHRLYNHCLYPSLHCVFENDGLTRLDETSKCFLPPDCMRGACVRGQPVQCDGGRLCEPSRGCA